MVIKNVNFIQELLDEHGNFLSFEEFKSKFKLKVNFLEYHQVVSAIPKYLKDEASQSSMPKRNVVHDVNVYQLTEGKTILFDKMRCKPYYRLLMAKPSPPPTAFKSWGAKAGKSLPIGKLALKTPTEYHQTTSSNQLEDETTKGHKDSFDIEGFSFLYCNGFHFIFQFSSYI